MRQVAIAALVLLAVVFVGSCQADFARTVYTAEISNAGAIPSVGPEDSFGLAVCVYERNVQPHTMDCEVHHNVNVQDKIVSSDIYLRLPSDNVLLYSLYANETINEFRVVFALEDLVLSQIGSYSVAEQEYDFLNGKWEIEITSDDYTQGEARGTLLQDRRFYARLDGEDAVPAVATAASGLATVAYQYQPSKVATFQVVHSVSSPTGAFVGKGFPGQDGSNEFNMGDFSSPVFSTRPYTTATEDDIFDGEEFVEITSSSQPQGEIRGQLVPIDYLPPVSFTARLDGEAVQPTSVLTRSRGAALISIDCDSGLAQYIVVHDVDGATETWLNLGTFDERGQRLFPLARAESPIYGEVVLTEEYIVAFYKQNLFITVETAVYPDGEIRGQVTDKYDWYAYLSGTNVVPPVTSSGVGVATFRLAEETDNGRVLDYEVVFSLPLDVQPYDVELVHGKEGSEGTSILTFVEHTSPVAGVDVRLSRTELNQFGSEQTYIRVGPNTVFDQTPYLRGQIYHIRNPCPFYTEVKPADSTPTSSFDNFALQSYFQFSAGERLVPAGLLLLALAALLLL